MEMKKGIIIGDLKPNLLQLLIEEVKLAQTKLNELGGVTKLHLHSSLYMTYIPNIGAIPILGNTVEQSVTRWYKLNKE